MRTAGVLAGCRGGVPRRHSPPRAQARDACMDEGGAMLWGRVTYEMMESYWPAVARGGAVAMHYRRAR